MKLKKSMFSFGNLENCISVACVREVLVSSKPDTRVRMSCLTYFLGSCDYCRGKSNLIRYRTAKQMFK